MALTWKDPRAIGEALYETHAATEPLSLGFVALRDLIVALPDFDDDPKGSSEGILETIQMTWYDEWKYDQ